MVGIGPDRTERNGWYGCLHGLYAGRPDPVDA